MANGEVIVKRYFFILGGAVGFDSLERGDRLSHKTTANERTKDRIGKGKFKINLFV